jgi:tRNA pseudouridine55 synthase
MDLSAQGSGSSNVGPVEVHGLLSVNKPADWTSHDVVAKLRRAMGVRKVGHTGTLDPMATGVLLLCVGKATKLAGFLVGLEKEYLATMRLGAVSDTLDGTGHITVNEENPQISRAQFDAILPSFLGRQEQVPPMYSAVKHKGQPLYRLARRGHVVERQPRKITIRSLEISRFKPAQITFRVVCSSGTYIRVLASDMGKELGCGAFLEQLYRTRVGPFQTEDALSLETAVELAQGGDIEKHLLPASRGLHGYPRLIVHPWAAQAVQQGQPLTAEIFLQTDPKAEQGDRVRIEDSEGILLAMARMLVPADGLAEMAPGDRVCKLLRVVS